MAKIPPPADDLVLGLDIGASSIGWSLVRAPGGRPESFVATGVRIFPAGVEGDLAAGKDEPRSVKRRLARAQRRQNWRRARRMRKVFRRLQGMALLPPGPTDAPGRNAIIADLDSALRKDFAAGYSTQAIAEKLPYLLRKRALDEPLQPFALGRALYHLAQRRGFLSNRRTKRRDDQGVVAAGIAALKQELASSGVRTLGEYLCRLDPREERVRRRYTERIQYVEEFDAIVAAQHAHHPQLQPADWQSLRRTVFFQRPLRSQRHLVARCELEPRAPRCAAARLEAQRFRYLQKINDLRIIAPTGEQRPCSEEERRVLANACETHERLTFAQARGLLGLKPRGAWRFNLEAGGETRLPGNVTVARICQAITPERWVELDTAQQDQLVEALRSIDRPETISRIAVERWRLGPDAAAKLAEVELEAGFVAYSRRALRRLLPLLEQGIPFATAKLQTYGNPTATEPLDQLPPALQALPTLRNPAVQRALTELRKLVNAIIRDYGKPGMIRLEMGRDLKRSRFQRERMWKANRKRERMRERARERLQTEVGLPEPTPADIEKMLLWEECNGTCPYTGRPIPLSALFGPAPLFDVEHIIPFSRSLDNSFGNKTLCEVAENRWKGNRTPFEAYAGDPQRWNAILERVRGFRGDDRERKLELFQATAVDDDFVTRQLNDTRYATSLARSYLGLLYGGERDATGRLRVEATTGTVTWVLRSAWDLNGILSLNDMKTREDHRHHAIDAAVVALSTLPSIRAVQSAARAAVPRTIRIQTPWNSLRECLEAQVKACVVSIRPDRRVSGPLHEDACYAFRQAPTGESARIRKPLHKLSRSEVLRIVDPNVRAIVCAALGDGDPAKVFAEETSWPRMPNRNGHSVPIRAVRIEKPDVVTPLGSHSCRFVKTGANHHLAVWGIDSPDGNLCRVQWEAVTLLEAHERRRRGEPVVRRTQNDHGRFLFSVTSGDTLRWNPAGLAEYLCVEAISAAEIEARRVEDARPATVRRKTPGARIRLRPSDIIRKNVTKVTVDLLGRARDAND